MKLVISKIWQKFIGAEIKKDYFLKLTNYIEKEYKNEICYPNIDNIFAALNNFDPQEIKVVILGQDPYHKPNQANGLSFSVNKGELHPPSLKNIFKELELDIGNKYPVSGDLSKWSKQGVLLLNAILTVRKNKPNSHRNLGWEIFTMNLINKISNEFSGIVFMLWGNNAKKYKSIIDNSKHLILESSHPSPLSANRGGWFGNKHFSLCNSYLLKKGVKKINW